MHRFLFKNKDTGEEALLWEEYNIKGHKNMLYKDLLMTEPVDINLYEEINDVDNKWPFALFGVECGKGWYPLIQPVIDYIDKYNKKAITPDDMIHILQIKEKWGELVIYPSFYTPELHKLIDNAEEESCNVCEFCGSKEHLGMTQGYYMTICHDCCKKLAVERNFGAYKWWSRDDDNLYWIYPDKDDEFIETGEEYKKPMP